MVTHDPSLTSRTTRNLTIADGLLIVDSKSANGQMSKSANEQS
jgi:ABC-type lipoprotein export system ATPase subunit